MANLYATKGGEAPGGRLGKRAWGYGVRGEKRGIPGWCHPKDAMVAIFPSAQTSPYFTIFALYSKIV
jgi:hypothetical protein